MALQRITTIGTGFLHSVNKILARKHYVYIAQGTFDASDIPDTASEITALYEGPTAKFLPFGKMDGGGTNITSDDRTYDVDDGTLPLGVDVTATMVSVTISGEMLQFASQMGGKKYSFLYVPMGKTDSFVALSGMLVTKNINIPIVEKDTPAKITFKATRNADQLTDVLFLGDFSE